MQWMRLISTAPVRYGLAYACLTTVVMGSLFAVIYWSMVSLLQLHMERTVVQQFEVLRDDFDREGRDSVIEQVRHHVETQKGSQVHLYLADVDGNRIAGDIELGGLVEGWQESSVLVEAPGPAPVRRTVHGYAEWLSEDIFAYAGQDTIDLDQSRALILRSFAIALGAVVLLSLGGGVAIGRVVLRRVDRLDRAARAIVEGDLSRRIPADDSRDEIGRITESINRMLDRIEELMDNLRHVNNDIAHDLRTPLGRLRQRLEASRLTAGSPGNYEESIDRAIDETDNILKIFEAMLRIGQIESGARKARFTAVDLTDLAATAVEVFDAVAEDRDRRIEADLEGRHVVLGDRELLMQLLANLIENALIHTPAGSTIRVGLACRNERVTLSVSDNGPGIPEQHRDKVLRRFYRLDGSRNTPGNGLGLSLVAAVAKLHEADLRLEDKGPGLRVAVEFGALEEAVVA